MNPIRTIKIISVIRAYLPAHSKRVIIWCQFAYIVCFLTYIGATLAGAQNSLPLIKPVPKPVQLGPFVTHLIDVDTLILAPDARKTFRVDGSPYSAAILDTGLRTSHQDFSGRVIDKSNFTTDNNNNSNDVADGNGHGTNVAGIIAANKIHTGIAPGARLVPLKVLKNDGSGTFDGVDKALQWVEKNFIKDKITVVSLSLGDNGNYINDSAFPSDNIHARIQELKKLNIPVVIAAGNGWFANNSMAGVTAQEGMSYPAIFPEAVSVGAVFDSEVKTPVAWTDGSIAYIQDPDQITPFSQRLHDSGTGYETDVFAPGSHVVSSGIDSDVGESVQDGTSQACPIITGVILLVQQYYSRITSSGSTLGVLPTVDQIKKWLRLGSVDIVDQCPAVSQACDNVIHTRKTYRRINVVKVLQAVTQDVQNQVLAEGVPTSQLKDVVKARAVQSEIR